MKKLIAYLKALFARPAAQPVIKAVEVAAAPAVEGALAKAEASVGSNVAESVIVGAAAAEVQKLIGN